MIAEHTTNRTESTTATAATTHRSPGWPEILIGMLAYGICFALVFALLPLAGGGAAGAIIGLFVSGAMGLIAFAAAWGLRIRDLGAFGIRRVKGSYLWAGAGLGLVAMLVGSTLSVVYVVLSGDMQTPQSSYQAAAAGGALSLALTLFAGSVITPIGEEALFRGVIANVLLRRYGLWIGAFGSAIIFALCHGINTVLPSAFMVGLVAALIFRRTGSIWPGVVAHAVNNLASSLLPLAVAALQLG